MFTRRAFLAASALSLIARRRSLALQSPVIAVYKDPACQCCAKWVKHLSANGFVSTVHDTPNMDEIKRTLNVPANLDLRITSATTTSSATQVEAGIYCYVLTTEARESAGDTGADRTPSWTNWSPSG